MSAATVLSSLLWLNVGYAETELRPADDTSAAELTRADATRAQLGWSEQLVVRYYAGMSVGDGLRFNNPFRLSEPLGDSPESISRTAVYGVVSVGGAVGYGFGFSHGAQLDLITALEGIEQQVLTPSYVLSREISGRVQLMARAGLPIVLTPDANLGAELGTGVMWRLTAGLGLTAELVGSLFYGAATHEVSHTQIPILAAQFGVRADLESMP